MPPKSKKPKVDFFELLRTFKERDELYHTYSSAWNKVYSSDFVQSPVLTLNEKFGLVVSKFGITSVIQVLDAIRDSDAREVCPEFVSKTLGFSITLCEVVLNLKLQLQPPNPTPAPVVVAVTATDSASASPTTTTTSRCSSSASSPTSSSATSTNATPVTISATHATTGPTDMTDDGDIATASATVTVSATATSASTTSSATASESPASMASTSTTTTSDVLSTTNTILFAPPSLKCLKCFSKLYKDHQPVKVKYFTLQGLKYGKKINLKCRFCEIVFKYDMYGSNRTFWTFYEEQRIAVEANDCVFVERQLFELQCNLANHSWVSFVGFSESYNGTFRLTRSTGFGAKLVSSTFFRGELENEMRSLKQLDMFQLMTVDKDREKLFQKIETIRRKKPYEHVNCHPNCSAKGCGRVFVVDGIWKLNFPHCMHRIKSSPKAITLPSLPNVCTSSPVHGKAFCPLHCELVEKSNIPTGLHDFLKYCGASSSDSSGSTDGGTPTVVNPSISDETELVCGPENLSDLVVGDQTIQTVDRALEMMAPSSDGETVIEAQGTSTFVNENPVQVSRMMEECVESIPSSCKKDTGSKKRLQKWSRGHLFVVRAGGHIEYWQSLFVSESPSQVFLILLAWLSIHLKRVPTDEWTNLAIVYDNMCHVDNMIVARKQLPLPWPWSRMWMAPHKCIDRLHIRNHVDKECLSKYQPKDHLRDADNTLSCEQTFVWLSRYKKIVCAMPKSHHLFYIHRMVLRRNLYTEFCYKQGCDPVLPVVKSSKTS